MNTPCCRVRADVDGVRIALKLEGHNPTGSIKDRLIAHLLVEAAAEGALRPGIGVVEVSTGNSGVALARAARLLGHPCEVLLPDSVRSEIVQRIREQGGVPVLLPLDLGPQHAFAVARRRADEGCFWPNQYANPRAPEAYEGLADELLADAPDLDCLIAGVGTGGTLYGVATTLVRRRKVRIIAVEPLADEAIEGLRNTDLVRPPHDMYPRDLAHETLRYTRPQAEAGRRLLALQGIQAGPSSGAVYVAALELARRKTWRSIVGICADGKKLEGNR